MFWASFSMILVSEIGDKTFLIAAIMAMTNPRILVYSASITALILMTLISVFLGHLLNQFIPPLLIHCLSSLLFLVFGAVMLKNPPNLNEELNDVEKLLQAEEEKQSLWKTWVQIFVLTFLAEWGDRSQISSYFK
jgi:putative Ca2+/H+ antiporter (TMEM165/GDT1 family)